MIWELLLTAAVILVAYWVVRTRAREPRLPTAALPAPPPRRRLPPGLLRHLALALAALAMVGSAFALYDRWEHRREILRVQIVNANTGVSIEYRARRGQIDGRRFVTLEGQEIGLAEVERMVLTPERQSQSSPPSAP